MSWGGDQCGYGEHIGRGRYEHPELSQDSTIVAMALSFVRENDELTVEQAMDHATKFVQTASLLTVTVGHNRRDAIVYHGPNRIKRHARCWVGCGC